MALSTLVGGTQSARAAIEYLVTSTQGLSQVAARIKGANDSGTHVVRFGAYDKVGQFRLEAPPAKVDSLIFERLPGLESDSALRVSEDSALIEIKGMKRGTVVLRGLAIHLATPEARLLSGAEAGRENANLLIDSCFIFGEANASSFLSWLGVMGSKVEIRRSFLVFDSSTATLSKAVLTATHLTLTNNLFNYGGQLHATVLQGGLFSCKSNTVNRTQFRLASTSFQSARYEFSRNYIAHAGSQDAFGNTKVYFLWATDFNALDSYVRKTHILRNWTGFDHPGTLPPMFASDSSNRWLEVRTANPATELWNWYRHKEDTLIGFETGDEARGARYDVWPGAPSAPFVFEGHPSKVHFRLALFPRQLKVGRTLVAVPGDLDSLRFHSPLSGALRFGPFQVDSITIGMATTFGQAQLLSADSSLVFTPQRIVSAYGAPSHVFVNELPAARYYLVAFKGNTPRGIQVALDGSSSLGPGDTLAYAQVDSAGHTVLLEENTQVPAYPDSLRKLDRNLSVRTSAVLSGTMTFGSTANIAPWRHDQVFWWRPKDGSLSKAESVNGRFVSTAPALPVFSVFLVERLNVKRGKTTAFPLRGGGQVRAMSTDGFQLRIDSLYQPDALRFGQATSGYALAWQGRGDGDSLILRLPGGKEVEAMRVTADSTFPAVAAPRDSQGYFLIPVAQADSNIRFFTAIRFNVVAGKAFQGSVDGVTVGSLLSSTSGILEFGPFDETLLNRSIGTADVLPSNSKVLGAKAIKTLSLNPVQSYDIRFQLSPAQDTGRVEAFAWNGQGWRKLPGVAYSAGDSLYPWISGLQGLDQAVVVLERLLPTDTYVTTQDSIGPGRKITVSVVSINAHKPIVGFFLHVRKVDQFGTITTDTIGPKLLGNVAEKDLSGESGLFSYAVQYLTPAGPYGSLLLFKPILQFGWLGSRLNLGQRVKAVRQWHLLGFPFATTFSRSLTEGSPPPATVRNIRGVLKLKSQQDGRAAWDTVYQEGSLNIQPGDAFLFSAASVHTLQAPADADLLPALPRSLTGGFQGGWRFLAAPFPMSFSPDRVQSSEGLPGPFFELVVTENPAGSPTERSYDWKTVDEGVLKPFVGYAYQFAPAETLSFDPWASVGEALTKSAAGAAPGKTASLRLTLETQGVTRSARMLAGPQARDVGYLPPLGAGPQMRIPGKGGFLWKRIESVDAIDEGLEIRGGEGQPARLTGIPTGLADAGDWTLRLLDLSTGVVHDPAGFTLPKGTGEYRILAGSSDFVAERIKLFQAGAPSDLILSQNVPNPFRQTTRIALDWPVFAGKVGARRAWLEVFDTRGRQVQRLELGPIRVGRHWVSIDASRWMPGVYAYRLTVVAGRSVTRLQKRMLVSP